MNIETNIFKAAQDIIVELQYRGPARDANGSTLESRLNSIYLGWTGLPSKRPASSGNPRNGPRGGGNKDGNATIEIDATLARTLGIAEGQKVGR